MGNKITDIEIVKKPNKFWELSGPMVTTVEIYRIENDPGTYRCYKNPTNASLRRIERFIPPALQRIIRSEDEDGWRHERTWACDNNPRYERDFHPSQRKDYISLHFSRKNGGEG
ncbi:MAG TPA: hypothetical protein PKD55_26680 [Bellilinea sp.]|nr:hypothetical protein [Bellilinea sp.]